MAWTKRKQKALDPNSVEQMDAFNEEYSRACKKLGIPRDQMQVTLEQAAEYLGLATSTVTRYAYANPPIFDLVKVPRPGADRAYTVEVTLDSVVEYKMLTKSYKKTA